MYLTKLHERINAEWTSIPLRWRLEITSAFYTFATASVLEAGIQYQIYGNTGPSKAGIALAILAACLRSGVKALGKYLFYKISEWLASRKSP